MDQHFMTGFEKEAGIMSALGKTVKKGKEAIKALKGTARAVGEKAKVDYELGKKGLSGISLKDAKKRLAKRDAAEAAAKTKALRKADYAERAAKAKETKAAKKAKAEAKARKTRETKERNKALKEQAKQEEIRKSLKYKAKTYGVPVAALGAGAGATEGARYYQEKQKQNQYKYASNEDVIKEAFLKNLKEFAKAMMGPKHLRPSIQHELKPEQLEMILKKVDDVKPKIGPGTVIGAAILAGMGAPIGAAMVKGTASGAEKILSTVPHPMRRQESPQGYPPQAFR